MHSVLLQNGRSVQHGGQQREEGETNGDAACWTTRSPQPEGVKPFPPYDDLINKDGNLKFPSFSLYRVEQDMIRNIVDEQGNLVLGKIGERQFHFLQLIFPVFYF